MFSFIIGTGADGAGSSVPPPLFVPSWGIHRRSRVETPEECRDLLLNMVPPAVREEMNMLDNNVVLDRAWFNLARGAMAQAHALSQFESLYVAHHALQDQNAQLISHAARARQEFNTVQDFYNTLSERNTKLREEHALCAERYSALREEKEVLEAINASQDLRVKELEQQLAGEREAHSVAMKDLERQIAEKDSAVVYNERIARERLSDNERLRMQVVAAQKEKNDAISKLFPTVFERLLRSHEYKESVAVPFNYALQTGWGQGLSEGKTEEELRGVMMRMRNFDAYSDKKMNAEFDRLFSKTYPYVDRIVRNAEKPVQELLKLHPNPPPRDAPKAGSGGVTFAPKLVRAAEAAQLKTTEATQPRRGDATQIRRGETREPAKSKTGPSTHGASSKHTSGGSRGPQPRKN